MRLRWLLCHRGLLLDSWQNLRSHEGLQRVQLFLLVCILLRLALSPDGGARVSLWGCSSYSNLVVLHEGIQRVDLIVDCSRACMELLVSCNDCRQA